jgi:excisionase family DNA binding protein
MSQPLKQTSNPADVVLTSAEASSYLKIHPRTLIRLAATGVIPGFRIGSHWRFLKSLLDDWIASRVCSASSSRTLSA